MLPAIGAVRPWADPHVVSINRLVDAPADAVARVARRRPEPTGDSPWRRSLDGRWQFRLFDRPDEVPASAVSEPPAGRDVDVGRRAGQLDAAGRR